MGKIMASTIRMNLYRVKLPLAHEFTIARGSISTQPSLIVELVAGDLHGYGEVTESPFYGHSFDSMTRSLQRAQASLDFYETLSPDAVWSKMATLMDNDMFALSALDIAAHDLHARRLGVPVWQAWGLEWSGVPQSSFTIGIDTIDKMVSKLKEQPGWRHYKIKLGTEHDLEIVRQLREQTGAVFRVDANCGWTTKQAIENSQALAELGVEFIEQPLPIEAAEEDKRRLFAESSLPIVADEDCQIDADVRKCHGLYHGVNVKICKCGGLTPALQMLREARQLGMRTMVGCMVESEIGISGAAQLLPLLDYADLDGAVLLADSPTSGVRVERGQVHIVDTAGTGACLHHDRLPEFSY